MKIIFFGTPDFAATVLSGLIDAGLKPVLAVSQPDRAQGRKQIIIKTPVKQVAEANDIPVLQPSKIKTNSLYEELKSYEADFIVTAAYGRILPQRILDLAKFEAVNVHGSLLPKYRGASPVQAALAAGDDTTGVTILRMTSELDAGPMFSKAEYEIPREMRSDKLMIELANLGAKLLPQTLRDIFEEKIDPVEQNYDEATAVGLIDKSMGKIDWNNEARLIEGQVRAMYPWPGAFTFIDGVRCKIHAARAYTLDELVEDIDTSKLTEAENGTVVSIADKSIWVKTNSGVLRLLEIQKDNSKAMSTEQVYHNYEAFVDRFTNEKDNDESL